MYIGFCETFVGVRLSEVCLVLVGVCWAWFRGYSGLVSGFRQIFVRVGLGYLYGLLSGGLFMFIQFLGLGCMDE